MSLILLVMFATAGLTAAPLFVDLNGYKEQLTKAIEQTTGLVPEINGEISISFLPTPTVEVTNIVIKNNQDGSSGENLVKIDKIVVLSSFHKILMGDVDIKTIQLLQPVIELEKKADGSKNWTFVKNKIEENSNSPDVNFPETILVKNGTVLYVADNKTKIFDYINSEINIDSINGPFNIKGNYSSNAKDIRFEGDIGKINAESDAKLSLGSDGFDFLFEGKFKLGKTNTIQGSVIGDITNLNKIAAASFSNGSLLSSVKYPGNAKLNGEFVLSSEKISFGDLKIESEVIKGTGDVDYLFPSSDKGNSLWDIVANFEFIDLDGLFKNEEGKSPFDSGAVIDYYAINYEKEGFSDYKFNISKDLSARFKLDINKIIYNESQINNLVLDTDVFSGKAIIHSFNAKLPSNGSIELIGNIDHNGVRPILNGRIKSSGGSLRDIITWLMPEYSFIPNGKMQEYLFSSDITMTPQKIDFRDIYASFDRALVTGEVSILPVKTVPSIDVILKIDRVDLDAYGVTDKIYKIIQGNYEDFSKNNIDSLWLKNTNTKYNISIDAKDINYNNSSIESLVTSVNINKGVLNIPQLVLQSDKMIMSGNMFVNMLKLRPMIKVNMRAPLIDTAFFLRGSQEESEESPNNSGWIWSQEKFNLGGIGRFDIDLKSATGYFRHGELQMKNIILEGAARKTVFDVENATASLYGGKAVLKGSVGLTEDSPSFGLSLILSNLDADGFLSLFRPDNTIDGRLYLTTKMKTFGDNPTKWIQNLAIDGKVSGRNIYINGIDLEKIMNESKEIYSVIDMDQIVKEAMDSGKTKFLAIDGAVTSSGVVLSFKNTKLATSMSRGVFVGNTSLGDFTTKGFARFSYKPEKRKVISIGVRIEGDVFDPETTIDTTQLDSYITAKGER